MRWLGSLLWNIGLPLAICVWLLRCTIAFGAEVPREALQYQRSLTREARYAFGLNAPVPVFAGQIQQESKWNPNVCSKFACGLAQFTPATADWIAGAYSRLSSKDIFNPEWAIRALVTYDARLLTTTSMATPCDHWAVALSAYNGGLSWIARDRALCTGDCQDTLWWGNVELHTARSQAAAIENRGYPRHILLVNQLVYASWGALISCSVSIPTPSL